MTTERPTGPDPSRNATDLGNGGNLPNSDDPSRVGGGFPTQAVARLKALAAVDLVEEGTNILLTDTDRPDLIAVLAWIGRYVPQSLVGSEETLVVDGIRELRFNGDDALLDMLDLVRVNGRPFVPETPAIVEPGREAAIMALWSHLPANTSLGVKATRATYEAALDATIAALGRGDADERHNPVGFPITPARCEEAVNRAHSLRRPLIEGLECVAGEETVDGLFPGDPGYVRPL